MKLHHSSLRTRLIVEFFLLYCDEQEGSYHFVKAFSNIIFRYGHTVPDTTISYACHDPPPHHLSCSACFKPPSPRVLRAVLDPLPPQCKELESLTAFKSPALHSADRLLIVAGDAYFQAIGSLEFCMNKMVRFSWL